MVAHHSHPANTASRAAASRRSMVSPYSRRTAITVSANQQRFSSGSHSAASRATFSCRFRLGVSRALSGSRVEISSAGSTTGPYGSTRTCGLSSPADRGGRSSARESGSRGGADIVRRRAIALSGRQWRANAQQRKRLAGGFPRRRLWPAPGHRVTDRHAAGAEPVKRALDVGCRNAKASRPGDSVPMPLPRRVSPAAARGETGSSGCMLSGFSGTRAARWTVRATGRAPGGHCDAFPAPRRDGRGRGESRAGSPGEYHSPLSGRE